TIQRVCDSCDEEVQREPEGERSDTNLILPQLESSPSNSLPDINRTSDHCEAEVQRKAGPEFEEGQVLSAMREPTGSPGASNDNDAGIYGGSALMKSPAGAGPSFEPELRAHAIQPKLTVSHPEDESELEADRIANQVMRMPDPSSTLAAHGTPESRSRSVA